MYKKRNIFFNKFPQNEKMLQLKYWMHRILSVSTSVLGQVKAGPSAHQ